MSAPTIRGPAVPLAWSTERITGYVVEKFDDDQKVDSVKIEDEDSQFVTEIIGMRSMSDRTLEVYPLAAATAPTLGDVFSYGASPVKKFSVKSNKISRTKGQAIKWSLSGEFLPLIHT